MKWWCRLNIFSLTLYYVVSSEWKILKLKSTVIEPESLKFFSVVFTYKIYGNFALKDIC